MRDFNDADRKKKSLRIELSDNPGNLSKEAIHRLEEAVKASMKDGYIPCPLGWKIASDIGVSRLDVGAMIDRLGLRVTGCQLGFFKVEKTPHAAKSTESLNEEVLNRVTSLHDRGELTCANVFSLARELGLKPLAIADIANSRGYKLRQCQLGCF
ncbi:MAG TPA: hypothetical protein PLP82_07555 [Deltaproteobacteria bacterium]|jgi:hypothetical protein|nr:hypothetical protein [Deltaproteobacteria bacterium]OQC25017.1 MAG: hypothetical protein BWX71_01748 [Deltaproteobacteria bacterium ADurb.Bin072]HRW80647.1 hypothetical protein [Desulfomonilia bacterium]NMD40847.1 hypothetical protein [Deltaproteobacteria bacterium]HNQ85378.1 hypothetical protein [Deltaproteobacteria bacterium]